MAFKEGNKKPANAGRKKGVTNAVTKELKDMILGALDDAGGQKYLALQAVNNPGAFMALVGKVLPKDMNLKASISLQVITGVDGED